jgi:hypothetical protein
VHAASVVRERFGRVTGVDQLGERVRGLRALWTVAEQDGDPARVELVLALEDLVVREVPRACVLIEAHDEWQDSDRRYLSEESMALLNPPAPTALEPRRDQQSEVMDQPALQTA